MNGGSTMKRTHLNPVGLLSLMALPAVLWFVSGERSYLAFLIFLIFIPYFGIKPDEFFLEHVKIAALWAFFAEMIVVTLVILGATIFSGPSAAVTALAVKCGFLAAYVCFTAVLTVREWREWKELDDE